MPKRSSNHTGPQDANEIAFRVVQEALGEVAPEVHGTGSKNPAAVELGRLGGLKGGNARASKLSAEQRSEIAKRAAAARWKISEER